MGMKALRLRPILFFLHHLGSVSSHTAVRTPIPIDGGVCNQRSKAPKAAGLGIKAVETETP